MQVFLTSDLHFGHSNIIRFCNRPFATVDEMDEALIAKWNAKVKSHDVIYVLGDVFFCDAQRACEIMGRLNGVKHLVMGNHDKLIKNQVPVQRYFREILPPLHETHINGTRVVMCHFPLLTWHHAGRGAFMLHGHVHSSTPMDGKCRRYDVGVDANGYAPVSWEEIARTINSTIPIDPSPERAARNSSNT